MTRVVASIEARMGSARLPGKVLADVAGRPVLSRIARRLGRAKRLDAVILATSTSPADDAVVEWAASEGIPAFRGSESDVLGRVVDAHERMGSDLVVEVTGDAPFVDPEVLDEGIRIFLEGDFDVVSNTRSESFPDGIDLQVFRLADLAEVARTVHDSEVREHVSLHFYRHPERYRIHSWRAPTRWHRPEIRLLLDTPEDLTWVREVTQALLPEHGEDFGLEEILRLLDARPELLRRALR